MIETLPVGITEFIRSLTNEEREERRWRSGIDQMIFLRDSIHPLLERRHEDRSALPPIIMGWHNSKSCSLPVVRFHTESGWYLAMRGNFYNWKVSVQAPIGESVPFIFYDMFDPKDTVAISSVFCEGFPSEWVFGSHAEDSSQFTVDLPGSPMYPSFTSGMLFTFCFLLGQVMK